MLQAPDNHGSQQETNWPCGNSDSLRTNQNERQTCNEPKLKNQLLSAFCLHTSQLLGFDFGPLPGPGANRDIPALEEEQRQREGD